MLPFGLLLRDTTPIWLALPTAWTDEDNPVVMLPEPATDMLQADDDGPGCEQFGSCCFIDVLDSLLFGGDMPRGMSGSANFLIWCITPAQKESAVLFPTPYKSGASENNHKISKENSTIFSEISYATE
jgi:hypothetical protein